MSSAKILSIIELTIYLVGLVGMLQMKMNFAMYMMFSGMILNCLIHLWPHN